MLDDGDYCQAGCPICELVPFTSKPNETSGAIWLG
jgi:hypothetical protein